MRLFCCQFNIAWEGKPENFRRVRLMLASEPVPRGSLVLLPEMFATGFSMNAEAMAEPAGGPTEQFLAEMAQEPGVFIVGGVAIRGDDGRVRNEPVAFDPAGTVAAR